MRLVRIRFGSAAGALGEVVERRPDGLFVIALPDPWRSEWVYGSSHLEELDSELDENATGELGDHLELLAELITTPAERFHCDYCSRFVRDDEVRHENGTAYHTCGVDAHHRSVEARAEGPHER